MRKLHTLIVSALLISGVESVHAQCQVTGATPGGGQIVECAGPNPNAVVLSGFNDQVTIFPGADIGSPTTDDDMIQLEAGDDNVLVLGGSIRADPDKTTDCIETGPSGVDTIVIEDGFFHCEEVVTVEPQPYGSLILTINGGILMAGEEVVSTGGDQDQQILVTAGSLIAAEGVIQTHGGDDRITVTGGSLVQTTDDDETIATGPGNDRISLRTALIDGSAAEAGVAVEGAEGDDTVILGTGADVRGLIHGDDVRGSTGQDTLIFNIAVESTPIEGLCDEILAQGSEGQVTIDGLDYEWTSFETVLCNLRAAATPAPSMGAAGLAGLLLAMLAVATLAFRRATLDR